MTHPISKTFASALAAIAILLFTQQPSYSRDGISDGQWYVGYLGLKWTHRLSTGEGVVVAVIDTGVDANHPSLLGSVLPGADFSTGGDDSISDGRSDLDGHGTGMASLIAGHGLIQGVAPDAKILPVRVKSTAEGGSATKVALGIDWAVGHGATVINVSLATAVWDPREFAAVNRALARDVVIVAGAGNWPEMSAVQYPAAFPGVVAVSSISRTSEHAATSVTGPELMVSAPGEKISTADRAGGYALVTGTSGACAIVAGIAALIRSRDRNLDERGVVNRLTASAIDKGSPGRDNIFGYGIVDPQKALVLKVPPEKAADSNQHTSDAKKDSPPLQRPKGYIIAAYFVLAVLSGGLVMLLLRATRRNLK